MLLSPDTSTGKVRPSSKLPHLYGQEALGYHDNRTDMMSDLKSP